jgi:hypothetical protein
MSDNSQGLRSHEFSHGKNRLAERFALLAISRERGIPTFPLDGRRAGMGDS